MEDYQRSGGLPLRTLSKDIMASNEEAISQIQVDTQNSLLSEYGYKINRDGCVKFVWNNTGLPSSVKESTDTSDSQDGNILNMVLVSCPVVIADPLSSVEKARRQAVDARIERWVRKCPEDFSPRGFWSHQYPKARTSSFPSGDVEIVESESGELLARYSDTDQPLIYLEDKAGSSLIAGCPKKLLQ